MKQCIIFAAGDFNIDSVIGKERDEIIKACNDSFCIAADGGLKYACEIGIIPDLIIGDMDSVEWEKQISDLVSENGIRVKKLPRQKDDTDMLAAIREGISAGCDRFEMYGALGGRLDHTLANIQCLQFLLNRGAYGILYGNGQRIELVRNSHVMYSKKIGKKGRRLSVFAFGGNACGVTEKGVMYTLDNAAVTNDFPIGVSNEFIGGESIIEVKNGTLLLCVED